jgi:hypothetical protein
VIAIDVDEAGFERALGRKINALDSALGLASDRAGQLVAAQIGKRLFLPKNPLNIQDASQRRYARLSPVKRTREGADVLVHLGAHWTTARSAAVQDLYRQLGLESKLVRRGLWMDPKAFIRGPKGRFEGRERNNGYKSRDGLKFYLFNKVPGLLKWAEDSQKGTQRLRHQVFLASGTARIKLILAPAVRFCRARIGAIFESATRQAMDRE